MHAMEVTHVGLADHAFYTGNAANIGYLAVHRSCSLFILNLIQMTHVKKEIQIIQIILS